MTTAPPVREWWPTEPMDEFNPPGRSNPAEWLCLLPDGAPAIGMLMPEEDYRHWSAKPLADGDIVEFSAMEARPAFTLTLREDGSHSPQEGPDGATHFMFAGDSDTLSHSVADLAALVGLGLAEPGEYEVVCARWTDHRFAFCAAAGTVGLFVEVMDEAGPLRTAPTQPGTLALPQAK